MEKQIKRTATGLRTAYICFWAIPALFALLSEMDGSWVGMLIGDGKLLFMADNIVILATAVCVPVSLKLFAWVLVKRIDKVSIEQALSLYKQWSLLRLLLLAIPSWGGLAAYYLFLSTNALLCGLIGLVASLFCVPGERQLRKELKIDQED